MASVAPSLVSAITHAALTMIGPGVMIKSVTL